jgi:RNA polymerase primary sigma factor
MDDLLQMGQRELSLDQTVGDKEGRTLEETVADEGRPEPETELIRRDFQEFLRELVERLPPQEHRVVLLRFGFDERPSHTLADIGRRLGVSRERVRQIEKQALARLRRLIGFVGRSSPPRDH